MGPEIKLKVSPTGTEIETLGQSPQVTDSLLVSSSQKHPNHVQSQTHKENSPEFFTDFHIFSK